MMRLALYAFIFLAAFSTSTLAGPPAVPPSAPADLTTTNGNIHKVAPHLGVVASGGAILNTNLGSKFYQQARAPMFAYDTLSSGVVVSVPCFWATAASSNEEHIDTTFTYDKVTVEDVAGNLTQLTFSASASGACSNATNGVLNADSVTLAAPIVPNVVNGVVVPQLFWVKALGHDTTNGIIYSFGPMNLENGAGFQFSSTALTDLSGTAGALPNTNGNTGNAQYAGNTWFPLFVAEQTQWRSFCLYGTSRTQGSHDYFDGPNADVGNLARSIGAYAPYINIGLSSDRAAWFVASHAARVQLDIYCTDDAIEDAINDVTNGASAATIEGNLTTMRGYLSSSHKVFLPTTEPVVTQTNISVSSLVANGNGMTLTVPNAGLSVGEMIVVAGATPSTDNGPCLITSLVSTTGLICTSGAATGTATATGTITITDGFTNPLNQTTHANNGVLTTLNAWKRSKPTGFYAVPDLSDAVSSGRDSGRYKSPGCPFIPISNNGGASGLNGSIVWDGTHLSNCGYHYLQSTRVLGPNVLDFLMRRDVDPASNDNSPAWLEHVA